METVFSREPGLTDLVPVHVLRHKSATRFGTDNATTIRVRTCFWAVQLAMAFDGVDGLIVGDSGWDGRG